MFELKKAEKQGTPVKLAIYGSWGSGKTFTSLAIAQGLARKTGRIALLDTESGRSHKHADMFGFDVATQGEPYMFEDMISFVTHCEMKGYDVAIIDSATPFWSGIGGILERHSTIAASQYKGNSIAAWQHINPTYYNVLKQIYGANIHVIMTFRARTEWVKEVRENGSERMVPVGTEPEFRKNALYYFDFVLSMTEDHNGLIHKGYETAVSESVIQQPGEDFGKRLYEWSSSGSKANLVERNRSMLKASGKTMPFNDLVIALFRSGAFDSFEDARSLATRKSVELAADLGQTIDPDHFEENPKMLTENALIIYDQLTGVEQS